MDSLPSKAHGYLGGFYGSASLAYWRVRDLCRVFSRYGDRLHPVEPQQEVQGHSCFNGSPAYYPAGYFFRLSLPANSAGIAPPRRYPGKKANLPNREGFLRAFSPVGFFYSVAKTRCPIPASESHSVNPATWPLPQQGPLAKPCFRSRQGPCVIPGSTGIQQDARTIRPPHLLLPQLP